MALNFRHLQLFGELEEQLDPAMQGKQSSSSWGHILSSRGWKV